MPELQCGEEIEYTISGIVGRITRTQYFSSRHGVRPLDDKNETFLEFLREKKRNKNSKKCRFWNYDVL